MTGKVTYLTRIFGRGLDFVCRDDEVEKAGGVHVIQTFLSEDISEEIQIKGRTARQGKKGFYALILDCDDLIKQFPLITKEAVEEEKIGSKLYEFLNKSRVLQFEKKSADRKGIIERSLELHKESLEFRDNLLHPHKKGAVEDIVHYLEKQNQGIKSKSRTICLSDATGSMSSVWNSAKTHITEMIKRIVEIGGAGKSELMWVAYRDYSDTALLEQSPWSSNPTELQNFINKIQCEGGGDGPEAVEVGLRLANETEGVTRVVLIGDAEPHLEGKGNMVAYHKKVLETDYLEQAHELAAKNVPVFCFYMEDDANLKRSFTEIAYITGGKVAKFTDTNMLIDVISESVLDDIEGEDMVLEYRKTYHS